MSKNNYYAVARGRRPGIYREWYGTDGAEAQVSGFSGALYKGFAGLPEAKAWLAKIAANEASVREWMGKKEKTPQPTLPAVPAPTPEALTSDAVIIYTYGGCIGNPGPGGYGALLKYKDRREEISGGYRRTTNNRMELTACIVALQRLPAPSAVTLYSDSRYVVNGMNLGWARRWRAQGWMRNTEEKALNPDLWEKLLELCTKHQVEFRWVPGHRGQAENERCDQLSVQAARGRNLAVDEAYENGINADI